MKKILALLLALSTLFGYAQQFPITSINITMPVNPPANTASWGTVMPPVMITAQAQMRNGQVPGDVIESKILVTIKQGGSKVCGSYTISNAPLSGFNKAVMNWSGNNALTLLGQECTLQPGSYELCVQFFRGPLPSIPLSAEVCKTFMIAAKPTESERSMQLVSPAKGTSIRALDLQKPVQFRWQLIPPPKPDENINYRFHLHEKLPNQTNMQAVRNNPVVVEKLSKRLNFTSELLPPDAVGKKYAWTVEAIIPGDNGQKDKIIYSEDAKDLMVVNQTNPTARTVSDTTPPSPLTAHCYFDPIINDTSIICLGPDGKGGKKYLVKIIMQNNNSGSSLLYFNDNKNFNFSRPSGYNVTSDANLIKAMNASDVIMPSITVVPSNPMMYYNSLAVGNAPVQEVVLTIPAGSPFPKKLMIYVSFFDGNTRNTCDTKVDITKWPPCPCDYCDDKTITLVDNRNQFTENNNTLNYHGILSIPGVKIKQLKAELIGFSYEPENKNSQCLVCNKDDRSFGNITGGTLSLWSAMTNGALGFDGNGGNTRHTIGWWGGNAVSVNNANLDLNISLPPATTLSCCNMNVTFCIRITFMDEQCRSCSLVKCVPWVRMPKIYANTK